MTMRDGWDAHDLDSRAGGLGATKPPSQTTAIMDMARDILGTVARRMIDNSAIDKRSSTRVRCGMRRTPHWMS